MDEVDFCFTGYMGPYQLPNCQNKHMPFYGLTIYKLCSIQSTKDIERSKSEAIFEFLVQQGIKKHGIKKIRSILEIADFQGNTVFSHLSIRSQKLCHYLLRMGCKINSIDLYMRVPFFMFPDLAVEMMEKGINPHLIDNDGKSQFDLFPFSFQSKEANQLSTEFSAERSIHFSMEDILCQKTCKQDCTSNFKRFYYKKGSLVKMTDENRLGHGGFGMVFKQLFHGIPMAMKCVWNKGLDTKHQEHVKSEAELNFHIEEDISEIRIQTETNGPGILLPVALVRQQDQTQDENDKWIADNYIIYVYPLYDCNLYELHENFYEKFTAEILNDILHQCLTRKFSNR